MLEKYLKKDDTTITELEIPENYNGLPVVEIGREAFAHSQYLEKVTISEDIRRIDDGAFRCCKMLRSVNLPASLEEIGENTFSMCEELREVEFRSDPSLGEEVFYTDLNLPAELILAGKIRSLDIARPIKIERLKKDLDLACMFNHHLPWFTHSGAFALAAENDCFREIDAELLDGLIEYCTREKMIEQTAYFLELKKRKFGFDGGGNFEL